ncbi:hypothetical protein [Halobacillus litoralis]|nr:hypothetical protein [Halobacillus litoralis]
MKKLTLIVLLCLFCLGGVDREFTADELQPGPYGDVPEEETA